MTPDDMRKTALTLDEAGAYDFWRITAELCERLDAQNALLERIAVALEQSMNPFGPAPTPTTTQVRCETCDKTWFGTTEGVCAICSGPLTAMLKVVK